MKRCCLVVIALAIATCTSATDRKELSSPDGRIRVQIEASDSLYYSVTFEKKTLLIRSAIDFSVNNNLPLSYQLSLSKSTYRSVNTTIIAPFPEKRERIPDNFNELTIRFRQPFSIIFRAYNDGIAYRLVSHFRDSITVREEKAAFNFSGNYPCYFPQVIKRDNADIYHTSFEEPYQTKPLDSMTSETMCFSPLLVATPGGVKIVITESDIEDYPGMFLSGTGTASLKARFAPYPAEEIVTEGEFPQAIVSRRENYIARTKGERKFPWRVLLVAGSDKELPANDMVFRLASPSRLEDISWIKPGKATDEWIIGINLFNVPFKTGVNTATYKYYIDFAKRFGFDRIMMDAGWSDYRDLFRINPAINMDEIAAYAREKNVSLSMWTLAVTLDRQLDSALAQFRKWGVDFIMTDFLDRDDQEMVRFYYRIAEACAKYRIMIMYHGAFKTAGFNRTYPNAITREGVLGSEFNIWSDKPTPEHNLLLPFIRMTAGPMDYEPGILDNATAKTFRPVSEKVMAQGTRCHQAAMFIVYESPIQIFSGNPSQGWLEPAFMELLGSIPTTWDTTIILDARLGDYIITARKKNNEWFIGGMTDWTPRHFEPDLSFLAPMSYELTVCKDGVNADRYPSDYILERTVFEPKEKLRIDLAPGGGFVLRLAPSTR